MAGASFISTGPRGLSVEKEHADESWKSIVFVRTLDGSPGQWLRAICPGTSGRGSRENPDARIARIASGLGAQESYLRVLWPMG